MRLCQSSAVHVTLRTRICGHVWKSVSSYDIPVYICVSKFMYMYIVSICLLCRRKGGVEDRHWFFCSFKIYSIRR